MKHLCSFLLCLFTFGLLPLCSFAQSEFRQDILRQFQSKGEIYFTFNIESAAELETLTRIISIDNVRNLEVFAYASEQEFNTFQELGIPFRLLPHPGDLLTAQEIRPETLRTGSSTIWNFYPTYAEYIAFMNEFAANHPEICALESIGTSIQGREIIAVRISDNVLEDEAEPEFLYTSTIHGDETTGYVLMLHLIDYLLFNYGTDPRITDMINETMIVINPLANPDGTYWGGNNSVWGARRYNANNIDLNRNFPDPEDGPHPDGNAWQPETIAFMDYADSNHFAISANFHGGEEVFNYPWDTWAKLAADDAWWQFVGHEYVDTVHLYSPSGYFSGFNNGITNGYQWYTISGGRQDYMNYFHNCREVTLEISSAKTPPVSQLVNFWEYNYRSLLNYIEQANYGVQGIITDSVTGEPLTATILIPGHDIDRSYVYSKLPTGFYSRYLVAGTYDIRVSASGYFPKTIQGVTVENREKTVLDIQLVPLNIGAENMLNARQALIFPNPASGRCKLFIPDPGIQTVTLECYSLTGLSEQRTVLSITDGMDQIALDVSTWSPGLYVVRLLTDRGIYTDRLLVY